MCFFGNSVKFRHECTFSVPVNTLCTIQPGQRCAGGGLCWAGGGRGLAGRAEALLGRVRLWPRLIGGGSFLAGIQPPPPPTGGGVSPLHYAACCTVDALWAAAGGGEPRAL